MLPIETLHQIFKVPLQLLFYRDYVKQDVAKDIQKRNPELSKETCWRLAESETRAGRVPELDPLGSFRGPYETSKTNPVRGAVEATGMLAMGVVGIGIGLLVILAVLAALFLLVLGALSR